ncbi:hypothetical protein DSO57_1018302 [Entomophthora muscae]|uniref:Uncharacterized protein n=1 Tax=Entomophthora muscae TaxID=34485 RepID=A0ACC2UQF3_9FUNG|nr:hypothetical protein DSO57_1018302 [Entomophthora muscae]
MEDIKKLVADLVAKQLSVAEENETITKGLIEVFNMLDDYAKEMEELEWFCQQITYIASGSQQARPISTSSNYQKATDVDKQQKPVEKTKKKPQILLRNPVAPVTKKQKEKEKPSNQQDSTEEALQTFKKLVNGRTSKKCTEVLNHTTVKLIPEDTNMGYTIPMDFDSNIVWLGLSWKELFEAFKVEFPDGKMPIPLLCCMENTALLAEQQSYKGKLDQFLQEATNLEVSKEEQEKILAICCPVALSWAFPGKYHMAPQAISLQNRVGKRCPEEYQELFFITLSQEGNFSYSQSMGFLYLLTLEILFEVTHKKDLLAKEIPDVTKIQLKEFLNGWLANGPQSEFLASLGLLINGLFGSVFGVARLDQVKLPNFLNFCKVSSISSLEANVVGKAVLVMHHLWEVLYSLGFVVSLKYATYNKALLSFQFVLSFSLGFILKIDLRVWYKIENRGNKN